jgi:solute carrier family 27 fatty acid transporter 1/4
MVVICREEGEDRITFREAKELSCRLAHYFSQQGYRKGDVVALVMENRVDYCCYWLGLSMIGVIPALVNTNLRQQSLLHTITVAKARAVIFSTELAPAISEVEDALLAANVALFTADAAPTLWALALPQEISDLPTAAPPPAADYTDTLMYIYTSGTTGLPKAAVLKQSRFIFLANGLTLASSTATEQDIVYSPLPFYHTAATVLATGLTLVLGTTLVSRRKFSARAFWSDCCAQGVTCAQYIGEIARYLCAAPSQPEESMHSVRMVFGNGLRPQVCIRLLWKKLIFFMGK